MIEITKIVIPLTVAIMPISVIPKILISLEIMTKAAAK
jgi:hypothetical protein